MWHPQDVTTQNWQEPLSRLPFIFRQQWCMTYSCHRNGWRKAMRIELSPARSTSRTKRAGSERVQLENNNCGERTRNMNMLKMSHFDDETISVYLLIRSLQKMRTVLFRECLLMTLEEWHNSVRCQDVHKDLHIFAWQYWSEHMYDCDSFCREGSNKRSWS